MAYGFNLGQIEGLDSSVQTVNVTIANATESNTYTLTYTSIFNGWADSSSPETATVMLAPSRTSDDGFDLSMRAYDASDVGDTYNVTLAKEEVTKDFVDATVKAVSDRLLPQVTDADNGKTLVVVDGAWDKAKGVKSGIRVSLNVTNGTIESVGIDDEDATLGDLFDYGWENVSQISISEDGYVSSGTFLLQSIVNLPSGTRVDFGTLSLPGAISSTAGNGYINYITIDSDGSYTKAYSGTITITKY